MFDSELEAEFAFMETVLNLSNGLRLVKERMDALHEMMQTCDDLKELQFIRDEMFICKDKVNEIDRRYNALIAEQEG